jgi:hypothetical protein
MYRLARLALILSCPLFAIARHYQWGGQWLMVPIFASGVGSVVMMMYERRLKHADDPAVLDLR